MKKIPKKEYKLEYTSMLGDRTYAYVVAVPRSWRSAS